MLLRYGGGTGLSAMPLTARRDGMTAVKKYISVRTVPRGAWP